jgi:outer membrane protein assembly factor BamB
MVARWMFTVGFGVACLSTWAKAGEWPQFRGPANAGVSETAKLPGRWSAEENIAWKVEVPGYGWSSPIVWGDKVFVSTAISDKQKKPAAGMGGFPGGPRGGPGPGGDGPQPGGFPPAGGGPPPGGFPGRFPEPKLPDAVYRWEVHCLDRATGKTLWKQVAAEQKPAIAIHASNTYASETPVTDGERVYAYFGMTGVFCYDFAGNLVWKKDLGAYKMQMGFGTGASPTLEGDRLYIQCDNEEKSFLVALDKKTGEELWRANRDEKSSWSTPFIWKAKDRTMLVCCGSNKVQAYDPENGKVIWELGVKGQFNATPVADDERLYLGAGGLFGQRPLVCVKASAAGDITLKKDETSNDGVAWSVPQAGPAMASPLLYRGFLYILDQNGGFLTCYDAKTGKVAYKRERLPGAKGFTASPWAHDGKIFCLDQDGTTFVVQTGEQFKHLGKNTIDEMFWSSPALTDDALILRGVEHLYCIRTKVAEK